MVHIREDVRNLIKLNEEIKNSQDELNNVIWLNIYVLKLNNVIWLNIYILKLEKYPEELFSKIKKYKNIYSKCYDLETLTVAFGEIKEIPKEIGHLKKLKELTLANNKLKVHPKEKECRKECISLVSVLIFIFIFILLNGYKFLYFSFI